MNPQVQSFQTLLALLDYGERKAMSVLVSRIDSRYVIEVGIVYAEGLTLCEAFREAQNILNELEK